MNSLSRRRYQRGSIKDDKDRWVCRYRIDVRDPQTGDVKRVHKQEYLGKKSWPTKRLAQRELERILSEINHEDYKPVPAENFGAFAKRWEQSILSQHKPSTQRGEKCDLKRLTAAFGQCAMRDITPEAVQTWASKVSLGPKTVANLVTTFRGMWKTAKSWGYVRHDPFEGLRLPKWEKGRVYFFSPEEGAAIIHEAQGVYKLIFSLYSACGMRPGELPGIMPGDLEGERLFIKRSVWHGKIQTPKTPNAIRNFLLPVELAEQIREHVANSKPNPYGLVFVNKLSRPINTDHFGDKVLKPILVKLGIWQKAQEQDLPCGLFSFRHMNGKLMDRLRVPLKTRQKRLGHADPATTMIHYTESEDENDKAAAELIWAVLRPKDESEVVQ